MSYENRNLVWAIKQKGFLKTRELEQALLDTPRENYVPGNLKRFAYDDIPISIGHRQTVSQPTTVVVMTEALEVKKNDKILEIGAGSGWQAAILSRLTKKNVFTVETIHELVELAKHNLSENKIKNVKVIEGDGSKGLKKYAPYDKIIVTAASPEIPQPLLDQLKVGGKIVVPIGDYYSQEMTVVTKMSKTRFDKKFIGYFTFVPLIGKYGFETGR